MKSKTYSLFVLPFVILFLVFRTHAAEVKILPATRAGDGAKVVGKRLNPRFDPGASNPTELMANGEVLRSNDSVNKTVSVEESSQDELTSLPALPNTMNGLNDKRRLGVGDKLSFKVVEDEIAPRALVVTDSLEIDVPYIGRVPVANKTCKQFAYYVKSLLEKDYYYQATVLVGLDSAGSGVRGASRGKIYVMGQVRSQGAMDLPIDEALTVTKAILRAGGFGPYANKKNVKLVRSGKNGFSNKPEVINCAEILDKGRWDKDVELNPDDIVTVPEKIINLF